MVEALSEGENLRVGLFPNHLPPHTGTGQAQWSSSRYILIQSLGHDNLYDGKYFTPDENNSGKGRFIHLLIHS